MSVPVRDFLKRRRDRAVGTILGYAESHVFGRLSREEQQELRRVVLDAMNSYHDTVLDLVKAEDGVRNDEVVATLERLEAAFLAERRGRAVRTSPLSP